MMPVAHLRILMEDAVIIARLTPLSSLPAYLHDKALMSKVLDVLKKSDAEIAAILADPKEDLSWLEPFAQHWMDPVKRAELEDWIRNAY